MTWNNIKITKPNESGNYLVCFKPGIKILEEERICIRNYDKDSDKWICDFRNVEDTNNLSHWMNLPKYPDIYKDEGAKIRNCVFTVNLNAPKLANIGMVNTDFNTMITLSEKGKVTLDVNSCRRLHCLDDSDKIDVEFNLVNKCLYFYINSISYYFLGIKLDAHGKLLNKFMYLDDLSKYLQKHNLYGNYYLKSLDNFKRSFFITL